MRVGETRDWGLLLLWGLIAALLAGGFAVATPGEDDPVAKYRILLRTAWGPESPENLEKFLEIRQALSKYVFDDRYQNGIQQWALREAGTMPSFGPALFGVISMRRKTDEMLKERGLEMKDFQRMTMLVYGRWLRAVREDPPPENELSRALLELEAGLERHLEHNPPEESKKRAKLADRLAAVKHQLEYLRPFVMDQGTKRQVLARIDAGTRDWLEGHREQIESLDFRFFDTAPPPRPRPGGAASTAGR